MTNSRDMNLVADSLRPFGVSIFTEVTHWVEQSGAVNLSQGFPDFDGPENIRQLAADAIMKGPNQYAPSHGVPALREAVVHKMKRFYGVDVDSNDEVTITTGATEGLAAAFMGLLNPGDEVVLLEPTYDLYPPMVARAGANAVRVSLNPDDFSIPYEELEKAFSPRTKLVVVNNPQNPSGKVFSRAELERIADLACEHNAYVLGDEVYEHITFDDAKHVSLLQLPQLRSRAIVVSSTAKTFSMTGWKVGYVVAAPPLTEAVRMSHQFLTYCTPRPFQEAMAVALALDDSYYADLKRLYHHKRERLCEGLKSCGWNVRVPEGTYYVNVDIDGTGFDDDIEFAKRLTLEGKVAAIPSSVFWKDRHAGRNLVRFCFCKTDSTLDAAIDNLHRWQS